MTPDTILRRTASLFGVPVAELCGRSRARHVVLARQAAMLVLRERTPLSLMEIGRCFGRDHTTVMYAADAARQRAEQRPDYAARLRQLADVIPVQDIDTAIAGLEAEIAELDARRAQRVAELEALRRLRARQQEGGDGA